MTFVYLDRVAIATPQGMEEQMGAVYGCWAVNTGNQIKEFEHITPQWIVMATYTGRALRAFTCEHVAHNLARRLAVEYPLSNDYFERWLTRQLTESEREIMREIVKISRHKSALIHKSELQPRASGAQS